MKTIREAQVGKARIRLIKQGARLAGVVIVGDQVKERVDGDDPDAVWLELQNLAARNTPAFFGYNGAENRFLKIFPEGFTSDAYVERERGYKLAAKRRLDETVPLEQALSGAGYGEAVLAAFRATNLLSPFESTRVQELLRGSHADQFVQGAARFATGETKRGLKMMEAAAKPHDIAKWTAITYLPFLWQPAQHMFLKPEVTKSFAERVGHRFANDYRPALDLDVYASLLDLARTTAEKISRLGPEDNIDVQSFIWVVGAYPAEVEASVQAEND